MVATSLPTAPSEASTTSPSAVQCTCSSSHGLRVCMMPFIAFCMSSSFNTRVASLQSPCRTWPHVSSHMLQPAPSLCLPFPLSLLPMHRHRSAHSRHPASALYSDRRPQRCPIAAIISLCAASCALSWNTAFTILSCAGGICAQRRAEPPP